jgi:hypothetical protein
MDGGSANGAGNTTAEWLSGVPKMLPGLHMFAEMAGMELPAALGRKLNGTDAPDGPTGTGIVSASPAD